MNTTQIVGIVIAALIVIGGGYYLMSSGTLSMTDTDTDTQTGGETFSGSWNDLVARGGTETCTITHMGANDSTTGTVYVSGTSVRGDFNSNTSAGVTDSHMLKLGDTIYVWGGGLTQGVMMKASAMAGAGSTGAAQGSGVAQDQSYSWDCSPATADQSKFEKPSNVEFMDVSAMMGSTGAKMQVIPNY